MLDPYFVYLITVEGENKMLKSLKDNEKETKNMASLE